MKKYNNINEEISRMKSLFGESNLYGNLINEELKEKKPLVVEQKWKRALTKLVTGGSGASDDINRGLRTAMRNVDDAVATKFLNYRVANVNDMIKYLDEFPAIWKSTLGERGFTIFKNTLVKFNDPTYVKKLQTLFAKSDVHGTMYLNDLKKDLPEQVRDIFDELATAKVVDMDIDDVVEDSFVVIKKGDDVTIHSIDDSGKVIDSKKIDNSGDLRNPDVETKVNAQADVDARLKGEGSGGKLSPDNGSQTITDPVNPKTNPDVINGQILDAIDVGIGKAKGMVKQNITLSDLSNHMKQSGGVVFVRYSDGTTEVVQNIDSWDVVTMRKVDPSDGLEKDFVVSITKKEGKKGEDLDPKKGGDGGGKGAGPNESWWKKWWQNKSKAGNNTGFSFGQGLRYFFPQTSWIFHKLVWLTGNAKKNLGLYKNPRWSALNLKYKDKGTWLDLSVKGAAKTTFRTGENSLRLVSEQLFYGYAVGVGMDIYRTDWGASGDTRLNPLPHWQRWFDEDNDLLIYTSLPTYGLYRTVKYIAESYTVWDALKEECLKKWEEVYGSDKVLNTQEYKDCVKEVDDFKKEVKNWETQLETFYTFIEQIDGLSEMSNEEKERFCNGEEVNGVSRKELINRLTELKNAENKIRTKINEVKSRQPSWVEVVYTVVKNWVGTATENLESILLSYTDNEGNSVELTSDGLDALIEKVEKVCLNLKQKDVPIDTPNNNQINNSESEEGDCMCPDGSYSAECCEDDVAFQINIIPINIIDEDMG